MTDDKSLKEHLIAAFSQLQTQYEMLSAVMCDTAATRAVVLQSAPNAESIYIAVFREEAEKAAPLVAAAKQVFENAIAALKADSRWVH